MYKQRPTDKRFNAYHKMQIKYEQAMIPICKCTNISTPPPKEGVGGGKEDWLPCIIGGELHLKVGQKGYNTSGYTVHSFLSCVTVNI